MKPMIAADKCHNLSSDFKLSGYFINLPCEFFYFNDLWVLQSQYHSSSQSKNYKVCKIIITREASTMNLKDLNSRLG